MSALSKKIDQYIDADFVRFHSPAHAGKLHPRDLSEVEGLDDLQYPSEVIAETQNFIAEIFAAEKSFMLVGGASVGLQAACLALKKYLIEKRSKKPVLIARNVHKSVISGLILADLDVEWLEPEWHPELGIFTRVFLDYELINQKYSALILVNPSYEGFYSQIDARKLEIPLIVDEAHGAHYHFSTQLPEPALSYGADIVVQSWHKTLGSLTQTGVLHLNKNCKINSAYIQEALRLLQTTSPSYLLLESIANIAEEFQQRGKEIIEKTINLAKTINDNAFSNDDPLRFLLKLESFSGVDLETELLKNKISCEETLFNAVLFFINRANDFADIQKLKITIEQLKKQEKKSQHKLISKPVFMKQEISLRQAYFSKAQTVELVDSVSLISTEIYAPCPPGIPLLVPGQRVTQEIVEMLSKKQDKINVIARSEATVITRSHTEA